MSGEKILPGEVIAERLAISVTEQSMSVQQFMKGLTDEEQRRFLEIAHHLVYAGFESGIKRCGAEFDTATRTINEIIDRREAKSYMRGFLDGISVIEEI